MGVKTVIRNKSVFSWGCEPRKTGMGSAVLRFLKYTPHVHEKGFAVSLTEMGLFSPVFSAFGSHKNCMRNQMFY